MCRQKQVNIKIKKCTFIEKVLQIITISFRIQNCICNSIPIRLEYPFSDKFIFNTYNFNYIRILVETNKLREMEKIKLPRREGIRTLFASRVFFLFSYFCYSHFATF